MTDTIFNEIIKKLVFLTGNELLTISNFEEQLSNIGDNYFAADKKYQNSKDSFNGDEYVNDIYKRFYKSSDTLIEKKLLSRQNEYPIGFKNLLNNSFVLEGLSLYEYKNIFDFLNNFKRLIELENLSNIKYFTINVFEETPLSRNKLSLLLEHEKCIKNFKLRDKWFVLKLFVINNDRVKIIEQSAINKTNKEDTDWTVNQVTHEFILKKDIKEVSTIDNKVVFRNRIHSNWVIYTESLESAVELRNIINRLR